MFYLQGETECLRTLMLLTAKQGKIAGSESQLVDAYIDYTVAIGGPEMRPSDPAEKFCDDPWRIRKLVSKHTDQAAPNDLRPEMVDTPASASHEVKALVQAAIAHLQTVNPGLHRLFNLTIHTIFYHRSRNSGGGSISSAPGAIWCSAKRTWSSTDLAEFLVHELSHNLLFLDERRYEHYKDQKAIMDPKNFPVSAVLKIPRPLDRVFHSLIVASEVLSFRLENGEPESSIVHPPSSELLDSCFDTIESIRVVLAANPALAAPRLLALVDRVETGLRAMVDDERLRPARRLAVAH